MWSSSVLRMARFANGIGAVQAHVADWVTWLAPSGHPCRPSARRLVADVVVVASVLAKDGAGLTMTESYRGVFARVGLRPSVRPSDSPPIRLRASAPCRSTHCSVGAERLLLGEVSLGTPQEVPLRGYRYVSKPDHRDGSADKSQWTIALSDEYVSFEGAIDNAWVDDDKAWGLHVVSDSSEYLGLTATSLGRAIALCTAFFQISDVVHGYPSDPTRSTREIPPNHVRASWLEAGLLRPSAIRKLGRGLRCKL